MERPLRFCLLTQYFWPEGGAPPGRLFELCTRLQRMGVQVTVLTCMPNYPQGRIYDDYRGRLLMTEHKDGMKIVRVIVYPSKSARFLRRMTYYLSFAATSVLLGLWGLGRQDVLMVESPPLFLGPSALLLGKLSGARVVFNVSDVWPLSAIRMGYISGDGLPARMSLWLEKFLYEHVSLVTGTSPGLIQDIRERFPHVWTEVITNGADTKKFSPSKADPTVRKMLGIPDGTFAIGYCGLHGLAQGLDVVIRAARLLRDAPHIRFVLVGDGAVKADLVAEARREGLDNVLFVPYQEKSLMPAIVASMDAALVCLGMDLPTIPVKIYEAMASGSPVIAVTGGELQEFVEREEVALRVPIGDGPALADAARRLADDAALRERLRSRALKVVKRFDRDIIAADAVKLLHRVAEG